MKYIKVDNLQNLMDEKQVRDALDNCSLPKVLTDDILLPLGYATVAPPIAPPGLIIDDYHAVEYITKHDPDTGKYYREVLQIILPEEEALKRRERKSREVRAKRDRLLDETDWIITKSIETGEDVTAWKEYRQTLRDITATPEFPYGTKFPSQPN